MASPIYYFEVVFVCVVLSNIGRSQPVSFGLVNAKENQIIFEGEENVTIECEVSLSQNASVKIVLDKNVMASNNGSGNVLQYVIRQVSLEDSGYYICQVTNEQDATGLMTESVFFHLDVQTARPQCIHDVENANFFSVGDELIVKCYCLTSDACNWNVPEKSKTFFEIYEEVINDRKLIVRMRVGPLSMDDNNIILECLPGPSDLQGCSIGPILVLSNAIYEFTTEASLLINNEYGKQEERTILTILIIILFLILILFLIRFLWCLCCGGNESYKHKKLPQKEEETVMLRMEHPTHPLMKYKEEKMEVLEADPSSQINTDSEADINATTMKDRAETCVVLETDPSAQGHGEADINAPQMENKGTGRVLETDPSAQTHTDGEIELNAPYETKEEAVVVLETDPLDQNHIDGKMRDKEETDVVLETNPLAQNQIDSETELYDPQMGDKKETAVVLEANPCSQIHTEGENELNAPQMGHKEETVMELETDTFAQTDTDVETELYAPMLEEKEETAVVLETDTSAQIYTDGEIELNVPQMEEKGETGVALETDSCSQIHTDGETEINAPLVEDKEETGVATNPYAQIHEAGDTELKVPSESSDVTDESGNNRVDKENYTPFYDVLPPQPIDNPTGSPKSPKPNDNKKSYGSVILKSVGYLNFHKALYD